MAGAMTRWPSGSWVVPCTAPAPDAPVQARGAAPAKAAYRLGAIRSFEAWVRGSTGHLETAFVYEPVVGRAKEDQVIPAGLAPVGPVFDVVCIDPALVIAPGEAAPTVASHQCPTQCGRDYYSGPSVIHGHDGGARIAGESPHRFGADRPGQIARSALARKHAGPLQPQRRWPSSRAPPRPGAGALRGAPCRLCTAAA